MRNNIYCVRQKFEEPGLPAPKMWKIVFVMHIPKTHELNDFLEQFPQRMIEAYLCEKGIITTGTFQVYVMSEGDIRVLFTTPINEMDCHLAQEYFPDYEETKEMRKWVR